jgi:Cys-tRNA(Pro)/Cys-tRNA(Cys) deacylase
VFVDETIILFDRISVSAGTRGTQLILAPDDYLRAAAAIGEPVQTVDLTKDTKPLTTEGRAKPPEAQT